MTEAEHGEHAVDREYGMRRYLEDNSQEPHQDEGDDRGLDQVTARVAGLVNHQPALGGSGLGGV